MQPEDDGFADLSTLELVRAALERLGLTLPVPTVGSDGTSTTFALLGQRARGLYANVDHAQASPAPFASLVALRPLVELAILAKWVTVDPDLNSFLYMADGEAVSLSNYGRLREHAARRGSAIADDASGDRATMAALRDEGLARLAKAGRNYGRGRLLPKVERMVQEVEQAFPGHSIAMRDAYVYAYQTFSPWEHSSASSFKATAESTTDGWRWRGDQTPFHTEDIEAIASSMYAYVLETVLGTLGRDGAATARAIRDFVTIHWVRSDRLEGDDASGH